MPKPPQPTPRRPATAYPNRPTSPNPPEIVDPRWILSALGITLAVAALCAWIAVCALFYRGQWQLVLQPSRNVATTPASLNLPFTEVHFGVDATGQPQLDGWWIPSTTPSAPTALILHSATGSIADALPDAQLLHDANLNVLLFDYRGFGHSLGQHPKQSLMEADATSAFRFLTETKSIPAANIIIFARGIGASLAVTLCSTHTDIPALILLSPEGDFLERVRSDSRSRMVPLGFLFRENFPLAQPLHTLPTPKLLISYTNGTPSPALLQAADPKLTVELPTPTADPTVLHKSLRRFLDNYIPQPPPAL